MKKVKHLIIYLLLIVTSIFTLSSCKEESSKPCQHQWVEANCLYPQTCRLCNETQGSALGHKWENATCTKPRHCRVCLIEDQYSELLGHSYVNDVCRVCGVMDLDLQQMAALGIKNTRDEVFDDISLCLESVTYDYKINDYGYSIIRMVLSFTATAYNEEIPLYTTILCCKYETEYYDCTSDVWGLYETKYIDYKWNGLFFNTYVLDTYSPGFGKFRLGNENVIKAYKTLISNPEDIKYN